MVTTEGTPDVGVIMANISNVIRDERIHFIAAMFWGEGGTKVLAEASWNSTAARLSSDRLLQLREADRKSILPAKS